METNFPLKNMANLKQASHVDWVYCVESLWDVYHKVLDFFAIVPCIDPNFHKLVIGSYSVDEKGRPISELYIKQSAIITKSDLTEISKIIKTRREKEIQVAYKTPSLDFGFDTNPYGVDSFYFDFIPRYSDGHAKIGSSRMPIDRKTLVKIDRMFSSYLN